MPAAALWEVRLPETLRAAEGMKRRCGANHARRQHRMKATTQLSFSVPPSY